MQPNAVLDLGCGSGILALAAAKLWDSPILASDCDEDAVSVTQRHAAANDLDDKLTAVVSTGFEADILRTTAPFDLIIANILLDPLLSLASSITAHLKPGGFLILSGILEEQAQMLCDAYLSHGCDIIEPLTQDGWAAVILRKN